MKNSSAKTCTVNLIVFIFLISAKYAAAQTHSLAEADALFEKEEYYSAARLYQKILLNEKDSLQKNGFKPYVVSNKTRASGNREGLMRSRATWNVAESYRLVNDYSKAENWYKECYDKYQKLFPLSLYWYGVCLRANKNYIAAESSLKHFVGSYHEKDEYSANALRELENLEFIRKQLLKDQSYFYQLSRLTLGNEQEAGSFGGNIINDSLLVFTSTLTDTVAMRSNKNPYNNRLYSTLLENDIAASATLITFPGDGGMKNEGASGLFDNGNKMFFTRWGINGGKTKSAIYYSTKKNNEWVEPVKVASINIDGFQASQPSVTADGKVLLFSSDRPGGFGKFDIWAAEINEDGTVSPPFNLGQKINGVEDEKTAFYSVYKNQLIFSSNGRTGFGGFDFFVSKGRISSLGEPINMGAPFNSTKDDLYFVEQGSDSANGTSYFSSDRGSDCCLELYRITQMNMTRTTRGILNDCKTGKPIAGGKVYVKDRFMQVTDSVITDEHGIYRVNITQKDTFFLSATKDAYSDSTISARISNGVEAMTDDSLYDRVICLNAADVPINIATQDADLKHADVIIYFDFDKHTLRPGSNLQLDLISMQLKENPDMNLEIGGYTDEQGAEGYNIDLGYRRARSVADFLIKSGISGHRLRLKSYGECCPLRDKNPSQDALQSDKRVQFVFFTGHR